MNELLPELRPLSHSSKTSGAPKVLPRAALALQALAKTYTFRALEPEVAAGKKKAIWGGAAWESPLMYACDVIPIGIAELWKHDSIAAEQVGENHFQVPAEFCSMIKAMIGQLHLNSAKTIDKILYFGATCEPISNVLELAKRDGFQVYCIENVTAFKPEDRTPEVVAFLARELEKAVVWVSGKPVDQDRLRDELRRKNRIHGKLDELLAWRLKAPLHLSAVPTLQLIVGANHFFGNPVEYERILDLALADIREAAKIPTTERYIPLVLAGGGGGGPGILHVIEESKGAILGWLIAESRPYREDLPPLEAVADYVLEGQSRGELGEGAGTSATFRRFRLEELVQSTGARGIISSAITGCPYGSIVQQLERTHFKKIGIPTISLETSVHLERPTEEQVMRVRTFVEMVS